MTFEDALFKADLRELTIMLQEQPKLASTPIALPANGATALPLHRICDGVFCGYFTEAIAIDIATLLLEHGAALNTVKEIGKDSPLTAACSLHCDHLALLYHAHGADVNHPGCHGGTALHWSAWCGRDRVVEAFVDKVNNINQLCIDFKSTPLLWAIHGYKFGGKENKHNQLRCASILLTHGADPGIPNFEGYHPVQLVAPDDAEAMSLFGK